MKTLALSCLRFIAAVELLKFPAYPDSPVPRFGELRHEINPPMIRAECGTSAGIQPPVSTVRERKPIMSTKPTHVVTGRVRFSYAHLLEPHAAKPGDTPKYGVSLIIPKDDKATVTAIHNAVKAAYEAGADKLKTASGKVPTLGNPGDTSDGKIKHPLHDGDLRDDDDPAYANAWYLNAHSTKAPNIVDANAQPLQDRSQVYSGVYGRASVDFYVFNRSGNRGIAAGLANVQIQELGEPLGNAVTPVTEDFGQPQDTAADVEDWL